MNKRYHSAKKSQPPGRVLYGTKDKGVTLNVDKIIPNEMVEKENVPVQDPNTFVPAHRPYKSKITSKTVFRNRGWIIYYIHWAMFTSLRRGKDPTCALAVARPHTPSTICGPALTAA
jgi:hypothetical protein